MHILHVYSTYYPQSYGGVESFIHFLRELSEAKGLETTLISTSLSEKCTDHEDPHIITFQSSFTIRSCIISSSFLKNFGDIINSPKYDLVHLHFPWPTAELALLATKSKKPVLVTYHSDIVRQKLLLFFYRPLLVKFLEKVDRIVCTSENYLNSSKFLANVKQKCDVVPINLNERDYPNFTPAKLESLQTVYGRKFFLFIGSPRTYKGINNLLEAAVKTQFRLIIAGTSIEDDMKFGKYRNAENIQFLGKVSQEVKLSLLQLCHAVILPSTSRNEAFGISLLEGLRYGKPLISTDLHTGTSEVNKHMVSGLVIKPRSIDEICDAMSQIMSDDELYFKLSTGAVKHYKDKFSHNQMINRYAQIYHELIDGKNA